jgi:iron(III) transport system substrate-binding protein
MPLTWKCGAVIAAGVAGLLLSGCAGGRNIENVVVVYVSAPRVFTEPILTDFEKASGIKVYALYETATGRNSHLADRLIKEQMDPRADVYWTTDPVSAEMLKQREVVAPYYSPNAAGIADQFKDPAGYWTGFSGRARVILARRAMREKPEGITSYTDPRFHGRAAIANPASGFNRSLMAALFLVWGDQRAEALLEAMKKNAVQMTATDVESAEMVLSGKADFALVGSSEAVSRVRRNLDVEMVFPDQREDEAGVFIAPNAVMLIRGARFADNARRLIDDLLSRETQRRLAFDDCAQVPLHPGIETPPEMRRIEAMHVMNEDFAEIAKKIPQIQPLLDAWARR